MRILLVTTLLLLYSTQPLANDPLTRIINGEKGTIAEQPWMVSIISRGVEAAGSHSCGASLIAPQWVLTAAHCLEHQNPSVVDVVLGTDDLTNLDNAERIGVEAIFMHPGYSSENEEGTGDDIALMRLSSPSSQPVVKTATASQAFPAGTPANIRGWGNRSQTEEQFPTELYQLEYQVFDDQACNTVYEIPTLSERFICASDPGKKGFCNGDSGGPLTTIVNGEAVQIGVVSFVELCGSTTHPDVYARVSHYDEFIRNTMQAPLVPVTTTAYDVAVNGEVNALEITFRNITANLQTIASNLRFAKGPGLAVGSEDCTTAAINTGSTCRVTVNWTPTADVQLHDSLLLDVFDGSKTTTVQVPMTGKGLYVTDLGTALDLPEIKFVIDDEVEWKVSTANSVKGGSSIETNLQYEIRQQGSALMGARMPAAGTLTFSSRGSNSLITVAVDDVDTKDVTVTDEWQTTTITLNEPGFIKWNFVNVAEPSIVMLDAMTFTAVPGTTETQGTTGTPDASENNGEVAVNSSSSSGGALSFWQMLVLLTGSVLNWRIRQSRIRHGSAARKEYSAGSMYTAGSIPHN